MTLKASLAAILIGMTGIPTAFAQATNTFPATGNVGIGSTSPVATLQVQNGGGGTFYSFGNIDPAGWSITSNLGTNTAAPNGLAIGWNRSSGSRETNFINTAPGYTPGGFTFSRWNGTTLTQDMTITYAGNVGIGTPTPGASLEVNGNVKLTANSGASITFADGTTQSTAYTGVSCGGDFAESVDASGTRNKYEPGDVLVLMSSDDADVTESFAPYSTLVAGIYSTKPGYVGRRLKGPRGPAELPLAMVGIVPTKVSAENGPIHKGDLLVTASLKGYAMKGTDRSRMLGAVVGKAMGSLESGTGVIEILVTLQ